MSVAGWQCLCYSAIDTLGFASSPEKDSPPTFEMVCLGILVNTKDFTLRVPESRLRELSDELHLWLSRERFTVKELQSLLGKLSFVSACIHASRIFLSRLLNALRSFPSNAKSHEISTSHVGNASRLGLVANFSSPLQWCFGYQACRLVLRWFSFHQGRLSDSRRSHVPRQMPYIPFPGFFPPRRVSHLCSAIIVAVKFWSTALQHQRFLVSCDNEGAVTVINSGSTKDPFM